MRFSILAAALVAAIPSLAQEGPPSDDALVELMLRELGAESPGDPLALPGEAAPAARAQGAPEERASRLHESFGAAAVGDAELTAVNCDGPRCTVEVQLHAKQPGQIPGQLLEVENWIAASSPCAYTIATAVAETPRVRAAIDCGS